MNDTSTNGPEAGKVGETSPEKSGKVADAKVLADNPDMENGSEADLSRAPKWEPRYPGSGRLTDKVAIVTGADSGIGRAVAALFAREGCDVVVAYHTQDEDAQLTASAVEAEGRRAVLVKGDIGDRETSRNAVRQAIDTFGRIDVIVNNAGEQHPAEDIRDISDAQLEGTFRTNIYGMFYLVQEALEHLKPGAAIVNCTSITMYQGSGDLLDYSATKGAITAFTRSLSEALVEKGIRVNAVAPGPIWTPLNPMGGATPDKVRSFGEKTPMKRPGEPNEVAPSFLFLACDDASYMSGQVLHPNGGTVVNG